MFQALTSTAVKKGGLSTGDVAAQYKYKNALFDVRVDTESNVSCASFVVLHRSYFNLVHHLMISSCSIQIATTVTFAEIMPSTRAIASFKVPDYNSGKVWQLDGSEAQNFAK